MKFCAIMALMCLTNAARETPPADCADAGADQEKCSRTITSVKANKMTFTYWLTLESKVPYLHGHFEIAKAKKKTDGSDSSYNEIRVCLEIGKEETKYVWREQIAFHAGLKKNTPLKFDEPVQVLDKNWDKNAAKQLKAYQNLCQYNYGQKDVPWLTDGEIKIDFQENVNNKAMFLDFRRPLIEKSSNSMDLEPGKEYLVYISFYHGKDKDKQKAKVLGDKKGSEPKFEKLILNKLTGADAAGDQGTVYTVKASAMRNMITWGTLAAAATASVAAMY